MYNGLKYFLTFSLGAAVGSVVAWRILKPRYEQLKKEEIEEVREYYSNKHQEEQGSLMKEKLQKLFSYIDESDNKSVEDSTNCIAKTEAKRMVSELGYDSNPDQEGGSETMKDESEVIVISPEEFASADYEEDYSIESLNYYSDGVLTDDWDNPIEDVEAMVGDALNHFGEYEDDSVFVKNERYKCYYEILKDVRNFSDLKNLNPAEDDE